MHWFANVDGQVYGPYNDDQMQTYVSEGRITGQSLISNNPPDGFYPAIGFDVFSFWAGTGHAGLAIAGGQPIATQSAAPYQPETQPTPAAEAEPQTTQNVSPFRRVRKAHTEQTPSQNQTPAEITPTALNTAMGVFIVMAEVRSESLMAFLTRLQEFGRTERIGDSLWLVKSDASADMLRNGLSQTLTRQDRMFIVDCTHNKSAWFNIGADLDSRIRNLWDDSAP